MKDDNLKVYINKEFSGTLSLENEQYVFNYTDDAQDIVSLTMPIRKASWLSKKLHPIFQMNLPEGALKEVIKNHFAKIEQMDDINFLRVVGPYMLGRVKFNHIEKKSDHLAIEDILHNNKGNLFEELMQRFAIRSGVSGVQPKLLLSAHNKTTMKFEHYIIKSWEKDYPQLALNEYFCMRAIKNANLPTPEFYLSDDLSMFIMKRFDIKEDGKYYGFEDMCVLTARGTEEKYNGSYEEILRVIKDVIAPQKRKEAIKIFFSALVMSHLLRNGDGHLKNYGVIYEKDYEDAALAPIYDVITTTVYIKNDIPALRLSGGKLWWQEKTYKNFATQSCKLTNQEYQELIQNCKDSIITTKKEIDLYESDNQEVLEFLQRLKACWRETL